MNVKNGFLQLGPFRITDVSKYGCVCVRMCAGWWGDSRQWAESTQQSRFVLAIITNSKGETALYCKLHFQRCILGQFTFVISVVSK